MTESYPLYWPEGWPRTVATARKWSLAGRRAQSQNWDRVVDRLHTEIERIEGANIVISTNQPLRRDGRPYAARTNIKDPGAAVYFTRQGRQLVMAQDAYELLIDNIRSLAIAIEGLRQMERHGGAAMMERAFSGFERLPPPATGWLAVLGLQQGAGIAEAEAAFRRLAKRHHPDRPGGSTESMAALNRAIRDARAMNERI